MPVMVVTAVFGFGRFIRKLSRQTQDKLAESNTVVEETLQGIANVKAFVNEAFEADRYDKNLRDVVRLAVRGAKFRGMFVSFIVFCLFGAISSGASWYGSILWLTSHELNHWRPYKIYDLWHFCGCIDGQFPRFICQCAKSGWLQ